MRTVIVALVAFVLGIGIFLLWPDDAEETATTEVLGTTTTGGFETTTTTAQLLTTSTTSDESHVVESVEEAEAILQNHYFVWFKSIYFKDEGSIRALVILDDQVEAAIAQFDVMTFKSEPTHSGIFVSDSSLIRSDDDCLAIDTTISASFRDGSTTGVVVFRWVDDSWKMLSSWTSANDLWEADCDSSL